MEQIIRISELLQVTGYDSTAIIPIVVEEGGELVNRKISLTDIQGKDYVEGTGINISGETISVDASELDIMTKTEANSKFLTGETEPAFNGSVAKNITNNDITYWNAKQNSLISGENIKTINGASILGSGNIAISGGGTYSEGNGIIISGTTISVNDNYLSDKYQGIMTDDQNYVTDNQLLNIQNLSGTNTGDETVESIKSKLGITTLSGSNTGDQDLTPYLTKTGASATYQPLMGSDDNYVTDAEKIKLSNLSGVNTGDQDLSHFITGETDPVFNASAAKNIQTTDITNWNNKVDKVVGKSLVSDSEITKLSTYPNLTGTTSQYVRADGALSEILVGSGGFAANVYLTSSASTVNPTVKQISYINDPITHTISGTVANGDALIAAYLFDGMVETNVIDAGSWIFNVNVKVDSAQGITRLRSEVYKRTTGGTETTLFNAYSTEINNLTYSSLKFETVQNYFNVNYSDRIGLRLYITTDSVTNKTISIQYGDSTASYFNTPLALRHNQLRGINDDSNVQHMTSAEKLAVDTLSSTYQPIMGSDDNYVTDAEKIKLSNLSGVNTGDQDLSGLYAKTGGTINGNVNINGNLTVTGSTYETHTEKIYSKNDYIILRDGAVSGLGAGSYTGIEAVKYDGNNNGRLAFDNNGIARVGDVGYEQAIATREDSPLSNGIAVWNASQSKFITTGLTFDNTLKVNNVEVSLSGHTHNTLYQPLKGADEYYVSSAQLTKINNTSGVNTGDQDLSGLLTKTGASATYLTITGASVTYSPTAHTHTGIYQPVKGADEYYVSSAQLTKINNTSGTNTGDQDLTGLLTKTGASATYLTITGASATYATTGHLHTGVYSTTGHTHDGVYQPIQGVTTVSTTTYSISSGDKYKLLYCTNVADTLLTVSSGISGIGSQIDIMQANNGVITVTGASGVTILAKDNDFSTNGVNTTASLIQVESNKWLLVGTDNVTGGGGITYTGGTGININGNSVSLDSTYMSTNFNPLLVSGTNIKTINGTSILGSGNIVIEGGSTSSASTWTALNATYVSSTSFTVNSDITSYCKRGLMIKWTESSVIKCAMVVSSSYSSPNTTVNFVGYSMSSIDSGSLKYCKLPVNKEKFVMAGSISITGENVTNVYYSDADYRVIGSDINVNISGGTNGSTTIDINKDGTSMFTTKPTLNSGVNYSTSPFAANNSSLAVGNKVTIDIDSYCAIPATDLYVNLYLFPTRYLYFD